MEGQLLVGKTGYEMINMLRSEHVNNIAVCYTLRSCGKSCAQKDRKTEETIGRCGLGPCGRLRLAGIFDFVS